MKIDVMILKGISIACIALFLTACSSEISNSSSLEKWKLEQELILPKGFEHIVFADSVGPSRHLAIRDNGDVYIKLRVDKGINGNMALRDTNSDGRADLIERFGSYPNDGNFATEMRIHKDYLYFSSEHIVYRQKLTPGKLIPDGSPEQIVVDPYPIRWHNAKSIAFDNEGSMYVTFSAPTNVCEDWKTVPQGVVANVKGEFPCKQLDILGGIWKFDEAKNNQSPLDGKRFATGIRSVVAMAWNNDDNSLYAVNHGRDYLHGHAPQYYTKWENAVLPAEQFIKIEADDDFGWPYTYYDHFKKSRMLSPEYGGDGLKESNKYKAPLMGFPAHWAPNDMLFYKGNQFPSRYKEGAFVAFHGSTNRTPYPQAGYIVAFVPFQDGKPTGDWEVFADGFAGVEPIVKMEETKYRPMGLAEGPDGSLFISDSKIGRIWKVSFKADKETFGAEELAEMEKLKLKSYIKMPVEDVDIINPN